ncbi:MAG: hypothetical protein FJY21_00980 [Bacteroidetes bacterium]|nr:hypothetical protein [Bacteroidota bacterium]
MFGLNFKNKRTVYLLLAALLFAVEYIFSINYTIQIIFFSLGVMLFGIPHGSLDHFIYHHERKEEISIRSIIRFLLFYLGFAIIYGFLWVISAELSILLFILISAYHFGEMDLKELSIKIGTSSRILSFIYGILFLINYLLYQFPQVENIILSFPGFKQENVQLLKILFGYQKPIMLTSLLFIPIVLIYLQITKQLSSKRMLAMVQLSALVLLVFNMPILLGFGFYFNIWHAGLSMDEIKKFLGWENKPYLFIYQKSWLTNTASFAMILILFFVFQGNLERLLAVFFMAIAILTAPHMKVISSIFSK